jgi:hypothetical protein
MNSTFIVMIENSKKNQMFIKIVTGAKKKNKPTNAEFKLCSRHCGRILRNNPCSQ